MSTISFFNDTKYNCNQRNRKQVITIVDYSPFWNLIKKRGISQYELLKLDGMNTKLLWKLRKNENLNILTIEQICKMLDCEITEVVRFTDEEEQ